MKRIAMIYAENDIIGDGRFAPLLAQALQRYADMIQNQAAGHSAAEVFQDENGTRLTIAGAAWDGDYLPSSLPPGY